MYLIVVLESLCLAICQALTNMDTGLVENTNA